MALTHSSALGPAHRGRGEGHREPACEERTSGKDLCPRTPEAGSRSSISTITAQFPLEATCCRRRHGRDPRLRPACDFSLGRSVDWHGVLAEARAQGTPILIRREQGFLEDPDRYLRAASPCLASIFQ
jgi:hypothetical protein